MLPVVPLGRSPLTVVPLGVGCWAWGDRKFWRYEEEHGLADVVEAFAACRAAGLNFYDTAESYGWGKSEKIVGSLIRRSGEPFLLATKYAPLAGRGGIDALRRGIGSSLRRVGLPAIDLYQIHWADQEELPIRPAMEVLADAVEAGQVRAVGVSNFSAAELRVAHDTLARRGIPLASQQVHYSLLHRSPEVDGVLDTCRELDIALLAYSPLEQGLLTGKYRPGNLPEGPRRDTPWFSEENVAAAQPVLAELNRMAATHEVDIAAVALAWLLARPGVIPLPGARSGSQASRNARALDVQLTETELATLDAVSSPWRVAEV